MKPVQEIKRNGRWTVGRKQRGEIQNVDLNKNNLKE